MLEDFNQYIINNQLCSKDDKILVAVSGGPDSVVLTNLFYRSGYTIAIAHCNFKLRADESDQDEAFVRKLAEKYGTGIYVKTCDAAEFADINKCSVQEAARELRYSWFEEVSHLKGYAKIAVAQHADDQAETFFINLLRGSGVSGLKGIPLKRDNIIRPLLFANRTEIELYAKEMKLGFREDSSNLSDKYLRNRIRHFLLPQLEKIKENYRQSLGNSIRYLNEDYQMIEHYLGQIKTDLFINKKEAIHIPINKLSSNPHHHALLFYLLKDYGFHRDVTDAICEAMNDLKTGKVFYSGGYQLLVDREFLIMKKRADETDDETFYIRSASEIVNNPISLKLETFDKAGSFSFIKDDPSVASFDLDKLSFPLLIRKWSEGDRFVPLGMKGSKLVSDYLIDNKTNRFEKENVFVIESDGKIAWLIGYRVSDEFKIDDNTVSVLVVRLVS